MDTDQAIDAYLDQALGDADDPAQSSTDTDAEVAEASPWDADDDAAADAVADDGEASSAEDDADEEDDEEDEDAPQAGHPEVDRLRGQVATLEQERGALAQYAQALAIRDTFTKIREQATDAEWTQFQRQLGDAYKQYQDGQKDQVIQYFVNDRQTQAQQAAAQQFYETNEAAYDRIFQHFDEQLDFDDLEAAYLDTSENAEDLESKLRVVVERRERQPTSARGVAQQRREAGADRQGVRNAGGSSPRRRGVDLHADTDEAFDAWYEERITHAS